MDKFLCYLRRSRYWDSMKLSIVKVTHYTPDAPGKHSHPYFYELVIVREGHAVHLLNDQPAFIQSGNVFLIPPHINHSYEKLGPLSIYNVIFGEEVLPFFQDDLSGLHGYQLLFNPSLLSASRGALRLEPSFFPEVVKLIEEMDAGQRQIHPGARTMLFSNFLRLMLLVSSHCQMDERLGGLSHAQLPLSRLLAALDARYNEKWSLERMTAFVKMSNSSFRHQFKLMTGSSPVNYLLELRLQKAASLLLLPEFSISEVAQQCGFEDSNYFTRQFRRHFNKSPSTFRRLRVE